MFTNSLLLAAALSPLATLAMPTSATTSLVPRQAAEYTTIWLTQCPSSPAYMPFYFPVGTTLTDGHASAYASGHQAYSDGLLEWTFVDTASNQPWTFKKSESFLHPNAWQEKDQPGVFVGDFIVRKDVMERLICEGAKEELSYTRGGDGVKCPVAFVCKRYPETWPDLPAEEESVPECSGFYCTMVKVINGQS